MTKTLVDWNWRDFFLFEHKRTREHSCKNNIHNSRVNSREYSFVSRVAPIWNSLTNNIVQSRTLTNFKRELENFD